MTKKMNQNLFTAIKVLLEAGSTHQEISEHLHVSRITVYRVSISDNMDEYYQNLKANKAMHAKKKAAEEKADEEAVKVVEHRQSVTMQMTHYAESELKKQTEVMELISRKLTEQIDLLSGLLDCWKSQ